MYHRIVESKVRSIFEQINAGNYEIMLKGLAPEFEYVFYGDHALGGRRTTQASMRMWWQRAFRLMPDIQFDLDEVLVTGWPWNTRIATSELVHGQLSDGSHYENHVHQLIHMKWGRVTRMRTSEDTQALVRALDALAAAGFEEAHAEPIND